MTAESFTERLYRETRTLQGLSVDIADDPVGVELAARFLASAKASPVGEPSSPPATGEAFGAAGGSGELTRNASAASNDNDEEATARTVASLNSAG